ncbi:protein kinase [Planctomycetota bacterium]
MTNHENKTNNEETGGEGIPTANFGDGAVGPSEQIGPYKLLRILGEGGYGIVYLAERQRPVKRRVALKVIKPGMDTKQVIARFEAERQALALLDHPNIAHVFNAGTTKAGRPYFAMEYVKGDPITEHCDRYKLTIEERLKLFMTVCEAVQYAHQKAIIHRDIKPSNILVAYEGEKAVPMIIDFGVAKALSQSLTERTLVTEQAQIVGTPEYMSPEQAEMTGQDIDTRTDVYSLGVLLYELLTGTLPFDSQTLRKDGPERMRRMIREQDPKIPSVRFSTVEREKSVSLAGLRRTDIRTLERRLHGELDWITLKAMDKDRTRRYQTAYALAEDIQRYLNQEPVLAGPPSTIYKFSKFASRNKGLFVSVAVIAAVVVVAAVISFVLAIMANEARMVAEKAQNAAEILTEQQEEDLYFNHIKLAHQELQANRPVHALDLLNQCPEHLRHWEWHYLQRKCSFQEIQSIEFDSPVVSFAFSTNGTRLAVLCVDGHLVIRDYLTGGSSSLQVRQAYSKQLLRDAYYEITKWVVFSPDDNYLAVAVDGNDVDLISLSSWEVERTFSGHTDFLTEIAFSPDGKRLATVAPQDAVRIWDRESGKLLKVLSFGSTPYALAFSDDGRKLFVGHIDESGCIKLWDSVADQELQSPIRHSGWILDIAVSAAAQKIATSSWDDTIVLSDDTYESTKRMSGHVEAVSGVVFTSDGKRLASISNDRTVRLWDVESGREIIKLTGGKGDLNSPAFGKGDLRLVVGDRTKELIVFDGSPVIEEETVESIVFKDHEDRVLDIAYLASGDQLVSASWRGPIKLWNLKQKEYISPIEVKAVASLAVSPEGHRIAAVGWESGQGGFVKVWEAIPPHRELFTWIGEKQLWGLSFSVDGKYLITGGSAGVLRVFDMQAKQLIGDLGIHDEAVFRISASPDGRFLASTGINGEVVVWDGKLLTEHQEGRTVFRGRSPSWAEFSPNGSRLTVGDRNGDILILDVESGEKVMSIPKAHGEVVYRAPFSPDGKYIASCSFDQTVRIWEANTGNSVDVLIGHKGNIYSVVWSPDSKHVASAGSDGTVRVWTPRLE